MQKDASLTLINQPGLNIAYWAFNTQKPPFDKKEVRQAFSMAIDKAAIIKDVYLGAGQAAKNLIPPTLWSYNDAVKDYPYDVNKAKDLLAKAGVKTPLEIDLWYMPVQRPYNPNAKRIAEMMQADLAKIGVNAKLVTYEWGEYRKRMQQGEHITGMPLTRIVRPSTRTTSSSCAAARRRPRRPEPLQVVRQGLRRQDEPRQDAQRQKERAKLYMEMQAIEHEAAPDLKIAHSVVWRRCAPT
jgi:dipeptide transport system substrate-binding protein